MNKKMFILFALILILFAVTCKDPEEFEPEDPYEEAPPPPQLIHPRQGAVYAFGGNIGYVPFYWTLVTGAEIYEIQIDTIATFETDSIYSAVTPPTSIGLFLYHSKTEYFSRIRAGSGRWITLYTEWSDITSFYVARDI